MVGAQELSPTLLAWDDSNIPLAMRNAQWSVYGLTTKDMDEMSTPSTPRQHYVDNSPPPPPLTPHKENGRITWCEYGKAPTRQLRSDTRCCFWSGHTR